MLYKFKSQAAGDVIMTAPVAAKVLAGAGREASERGVIQAAALPAAIASLQAAMQASQAKSSAAAQDDAQDDDNDDAVPFHVRAQPFLELLQLSAAEGKDVMWGV